MNHEDTESQRNRLNDLSNRMIGLCIEVHRELGPGWLESYLKLERRSLGLLINFNVPVLRQGIRRVVASELCKEERPAGGDLKPRLVLLCASGPLWFKSRI